jgi:hypothetical protein
VFGIDARHTGEVLAKLAATSHTANRIGAVIAGEPGVALI